MAANQNTPGGESQSSQRAAGQSPFFNQSLGGGLTVQNLSGPLLFTPVPLSSPLGTDQILTTVGGRVDPISDSLGYQSSFHNLSPQGLQAPPINNVQQSVSQPNLLTVQMNQQHDSSNQTAHQSISQPNLFGVQMNQQNNSFNQPAHQSISQPNLFPVQANQQNQPLSQPMIPAHAVMSHGQVPTQFHNSIHATQQEPHSSVVDPVSIGLQRASNPGMQYMEMPFSSDVQHQQSNGMLPPDQMTNGLNPAQALTPRPSQLIQPQNVKIYTPTQKSSQQGLTYHPVQPHWFYQKQGKGWLPFSFVDSRNLEAALASKDKTVVATDGGRYDIDIDLMKREAVYWKEEKEDVRRCTWFYRGEGETKLIPYPDDVAEFLEQEFKTVLTTGAWSKKVDMQKGESVIFHNANVILHYLPSTELYDWTGEDNKSRPRVVRRGIMDIMEEVIEGEPEQIDHLVFVVHGIGPATDLKTRPIVDCVDDMRQQSLMQLGTHQFVKEGIPVGRVEFLPIEWYSNLHSDRLGVDSRLNSITLSSIGKFRSFTNETLTDILFFTSPMYCQTICDTVVQEMNRLLELFRSRNPLFQGDISVCGHSLGSCILFDILANQGQLQPLESFGEVVVETLTRIEKNSNESLYLDDDHVDSPVAPPPVVTHSLSKTYAATVQEDSIPDIDDVLKKLNLTDYSSKFHDEKVDTETLLMCSEADMRDLGIPMGPRKKLMGFVREQAQKQEKKEANEPVNEPQRFLQPMRLSAEVSVNMDSRITKGTQTNLFPSLSSASVEVAYERGVAGTGQPTVRYSKLNFEPVNMFALGSPIGLFVTVRGVTSFGMSFQLPTCRSFYNIFHPYDPVAYRIEPLVNSQNYLPPVLMPHHKGRKRFHLELHENLTRVGANLKQGFIEAVRSTWATINQFARSHRTEAQLGEYDDETEAEMMKPMEEFQEEASEEIEKLETTSEDSSGLKADCGRLNNGKRIDFVLQERPLEVLNEYLFALSSHTCYWTSEDTVLLMLRAIYGAE